MRILFTSTSGLGHLYPLLPLARAARDARHQVLFAVPAAAVGSVRRHGHAAVVASDGESARDAGMFWSRLAEQTEPNTYVFAGLFGRLRTAAALPGTSSIVDDFQPDLVISECLEFAGPLAAEVRSIPQLAVGIGPLTLPGLSTSPLVDELNRHRTELGLPLTEQPPWRLQPLATWVPDLLQHDTFRLDRPVIKYRYEDAEPGDVTAAGTTGRPTIYATMGSAAPLQSGASGIYRAMLTGLAACDADVLFSVGNIDPASIGPIPKNVNVQPYVQQRLAMSRDLVISHAGCGTTVATLFRGRPSVSVPLFADQPHNARRLADLGLAVTVPAHAVADQLSAAVHAVLDDPRYVDRVSQVASMMADVPTADAALDAVTSSIATSSVG